ncbi:M20 peptidase family dipeptidase [Rhodobacteraceae bacterium CCMM004]|nr:M20 peptidase family dipeptidase [Rhodobacteraceae bacterium CCMM004]
MSREGAIARVRAGFDDGTFLDTLRCRVAIPTESQEPERLPDLRRYLTDEIAPSLAPSGYDCTVVDNPVEGGGPFLIASRIEDPALPTLLTYGHGDVVRGIPEQWREGLTPWDITVEGDRWYGRGTADNKGQHSIVIAALEAVLAERGHHGFNSKMLIETSEEIGSPGLDAVLAQEADRLAADVLIASDGPRMDPGRADVKLGNRGGIAFDLRISLREGSRHSGHWGGVLEDPGILLAQALSTITTPRGRILIDDWLPKAIPDKVRAALKDLRIDPKDPTLVMPDDWGEPGLSVAEKMYGWTSFIVLAMVTGRPENPVNGVQPDAFARCQLRFTADADHTRFLPALREHLDAHGFGMVEVTPVRENYFPAWRTDPENPWVDWTVASVARTTGTPPTVVPNSSGGLPSELFGRNLGCPVLWIPHSYGGCRQHGPDEHLLAPLTREALSIMAGVFWDLGEPEGRPR